MDTQLEMTSVHTNEIPWAEIAFEGLTKTLCGSHDMLYDMLYYSVK